MVRFFFVVRPYPSYALIALAAVLFVSLVTVWLNPRELDSGLGLILFVQMFLASSGFAVRARRGHFDPLLTHGCDRRRVMVMHWCASVLPGAIAWTAVSFAAWMLGGPAALSALAGERLVAFVIVSALAWTAGFLLPRGAAGALWLGGLVALLVRHVDILPSSGADGAAATIRHAAVVVACPFLLLGSHDALAAPDLIAAACFVAALLLSTWRVGAELDIYLMERT